MTLRIELADETEAKLRERAAAEGKAPSEFALQAVEEKLTTSNGSSSPASREARAAAWNSFVSNMHEWTRTVPPQHSVDDSREGIYEGCGE